jgi:multiple sugar transport system ATP-binding protein
VNTFVAGFIGSPAMNMLKGRVAGSGGAVEIGGSGAIAVPGLRGKPGQEVIFGVRPEALTLGDAGIASEVIVVEPTGADIQVFAKSAAGPLMAIFRERHDFRPGDRIMLHPDPAGIHVFDAASGMRL